MFLLPIVFICIILCFGIFIYSKIFNRNDLIEMFSFSLGISFGFFNFFLFFSFRIFDITLDKDFAVKVFLVIILLFIMVRPYSSLKEIFNKIRLEIKLPDIINLKDNYQKFLLIVLSFLFFLSLYKSLYLPIVFGDSVAGYAETTKLVYENQQMYDSSVKYQGFPYQLYSIFPSATSAYLMYLSNEGFNDIYMKFLPLLFGFAVVFLVYRIGYLISNNRESSILGTIFYISQAELSISRTIHYQVDIFLYFFLLLGFSFLIVYYQNHKLRELVLASLFFSFAFFVKVNGIVIFGSLFIALLLWNYLTIWYGENKANIFSLKLLLIYYCFPFFLLFLPYAIWNIINFGDPLYPFLFGLYSSESIIYNSPDYNPSLIELILRNFKQTFSIFHDYTGFILVFFSLASGIKSYLEIANSKFTKFSFVFFTSCVVLFFMLITTWLDPGSPISRHSAGATLRYMGFGIILLSIISGIILHEIIQGKGYSSYNKVIFFLLSVSFLYQLLVVVIDNGMLSANIDQLIYRIHGRYYVQITSILGLIILYRLNLQSYGKSINSLFKNRITFLFILSLLFVPIMLASVVKFPIYDKSSGEIFLTVEDEDVLGYVYTDEGMEMTYYINTELPSDSRILSFTLQKYYYDREVINIMNVKYELLFESDNINASLELLKSNNIHYYLDLPNEHPHIWMLDDWYYENLILRQDLDSDNFNLVKEFGEIKLYKINYG